MSGRKGARYERQLVSLFRESGWFSRRAGASGSGGEAESYDVIAAKDGTVLVIELKYSSARNVYYDPVKIERLCWIADCFGGHALLVCRFSQDTSFYGFAREMVGRTPSGKYAINRDARTRGLVVPDEC